MPKLPTFQTQFGGLPISGGRRAEAAAFGGDRAAATRELAQTNQKVGEALLANMEDTESRRALVGSSEIRAKYARVLDEAAKTGADLTDIKYKMDAELAAVGDGFQTARGRAALDLYTSNTHLMYDEQANRIEVQRAASTARLESQKLMASQSAILFDNPFALPQAESAVDDLLATFSQLSPQQRAEMGNELKQNLNMTAALTYARTDPETAQRKLEQGEWNLTGEQRRVVLGKVQEVTNARRAAENHARSLADYERKQRDEAATRKYMDSIINGTLSGKALERAITSDADLDSASVRTLTLFAEHRAEELAKPRKSDPKTLNDIWLRVNAPHGDPTKVYNADLIHEAVRDRRLNTDDASRFMADIARQRDANYVSFSTRLHGRMSTVKAAMSVPTSIYSVQPDLALSIQNEMINQVTKRADDLRAANKDPNAVLDPNSKDYYFKPDIIKTVARDLQSQTGVQYTLEIGEVIVRQGENWQYLGGDPSSEKSWKKLRTEPFTPSGSKGTEFEQWMAATGGTLRPGQSQAEAIEEWKRSIGRQ